MIVDGKAIADGVKDWLKDEMAERGVFPRLALVVVGEDFSTSKFVKTKKKVATDVGIEVVIDELGESSSQKDIEYAVDRYADDESVSGIVVQLPLPKNINTKEVLLHIPPSKDVDALTGNGDMLSPVVMAVKEVLESEDVEISGRSVLVVGKGKLVGIPVANWFKGNGATVVSADVDTESLSELTKKAEIIVTGAGVAGLIKPDMLSDGVVLIDAGTSETSGELKGDASPECADKCSVFTPVPGGIGPIAVTMLLKNVVMSAEE